MEVYFSLGVILAFALGYLAALLVSKRKGDSQNELLTLQTKLDFLNDEKQALFEKIQGLEQSKEDLIAQNSRLDQVNLNNQDKIKDLNSVKENLSKEFENLANKIFQEKMSSFKQENKLGLDNVLIPFKEKLSEFQTVVSKYRDDEIKETSSLKSEIKMIYELNKKLGAEAQNLTKALKGDNKAQGNWGEFILEKILEGSGLREGFEYTLQGKDMGLKNEDGAIQRPDVIVNLPDEKHLIIDSKVSLVAYERYIGSETKEQSEPHLKDFTLSIKNHIKGLSDKKYHHLDKLLTPDFVFLFIPIEGAFSEAIQADIELFSYAWDRKIILVSPTTLMVTLKTVESIWRQEKQNKNALDIAKQAGDLYDKFVGFTEDLMNLKNSLNRSQESFDLVMKKLSDGRGNIMSRFDKLKALGAKANKSITYDYFEDP